LHSKAGQVPQRRLRHSVDREEDLSLRNVGVQWPGPAGFFEVNSLNCDHKQVFVSNPFSTYVFPWGSGGSLGAASVVIDREVSAIFHGASDCTVLTAWGETQKFVHVPNCSNWSEESQEPRSEFVLVPRAWRVISIATRFPCPKLGPMQGNSCDAMWMAGWDGTDINIASIMRAPSGSWTARTRFRVSHRRARNSKTNTDILALQLGKEGHTLAVLRADGNLDAWCLRTGKLLGQWFLGSNRFTAMCHNGEHLLFSLASEDGIILKASRLPEVLKWTGD